MLWFVIVEVHYLIMAASPSMWYLIRFFPCRKNCEDQIDAFLGRTFYVDGGHNNREGMPKLTARMEQVEVT